LVDFSTIFSSEFFEFWFFKIFSPFFGSATMALSLIDRTGLAYGWQVPFNQLSVSKLPLHNNM